MKAGSISRAGKQARKSGKSVALESVLKALLEEKVCTLLEHLRGAGMSRMAGYGRQHLSGGHSIARA